MELKDLFIAPIFIVLFYTILISIKNRYDKSNPIYEYFTWALTVKFIGAIGAGLIYYSYYKYGDTRGFFRNGGFIFDEIVKNPFIIFDLISPSVTTSNYDALFLFSRVRAFSDPSSYFVSLTSGFVSLFTFKTYTANALFFAFFSFISSLKMYDAFYDYKPELGKKLVIAIFFIPSVFFWGSGLFKDSLTFSALCLLTAYSYNTFIKGKFNPKNLALILISMFIINSIKGYVLMCFIPCMTLWVFMTYTKNINNKFVRYLSAPFLIMMGLVGGYFFLTQMGNYNAKWSLEHIEREAYNMQWWHHQVSQLDKSGVYSDGGGSSYSIGEIGDFSIPGMLKTMPAAINVTFFRPYIWEVSSPTMLFAALESMFFIFIFLNTARKAGLMLFFKSIFQNPFVLFCLSFAILFGFGVGYTSFNFGALVRYKIPCLPFFLIAIFMIENESKNKNFIKALKPT